MMGKIKQFNLISLIEYIFIFVLILDCRSVFSRSYSISIPFSGILISLMIILIFLKNKLSFKINLTHKQIYFLFFLVFYELVFILFSVDSSNLMNFLCRFILFLPGFILLLYQYYNEGNVYRLFEVFVNIVVVLAIISLFFWIFGSCFKIIKPIGTIEYKWGGSQVANNYYYLYFERHTLDSFLGFSNVYRNCSIFTEAPMYMVILASSFLSELLLINHKSKIKITILAVTLLTTLSATGIIVVVSSAILYLLSVIKINNKINKIIFYSTLFIVGGFIFYLVFIWRYGDSSFSTRFDDIRSGLLAWRTSPVFGIGYNNYTVINSFMSEFRLDNTGFSSGLFCVLGQGGLWLAIIYLIPIFLNIGKLFTKDKTLIGILYLEIMFIFIFIIYQYTYLLLIFISLGYLYLFIKLGSDNEDSLLSDKI